MAENEKTTAATNEKKPEKKASKPSVFSRMGKFFHDYKAETKKVTWASREDTLRNFLVVGVIVVVVGLVTGALDLGFTSGVKALTKLFN